MKNLATRACSWSKLNTVNFIVRLAATVLLLTLFCAAQEKKIVYTADEQPIAEQIHSLRSLPDDVRAKTTKDLALRIRALPSSSNKLRLAEGLAGLSTEGDFGHDTLQEVATTLAEALKEHPVPWEKPEQAAAADGAVKGQHPSYQYKELAALVRYEHVQASVDDPQFAAAMKQLEAEDARREHPDFTLTDLNGKVWKFRDLQGKVVLVNFWATWCPPCRKEMPDLQTLYERFRGQGFVVLAISDEKSAKVAPFIQERKVTFPVLLDPDRKVNGAFSVEGIPKSFVYDREGKLVAQSIDMRTQKQFVEMIAKAGIQ